MPSKLTSAIIAVLLFPLIYVLAPANALAITAEVAKKCSALTAKAFPPRVVGNPAAGVQNGSYQDFRNYFNQCVANGGNPPEQNQHPAQSPDAGTDKNKQAPNK